MWTRLKALPRVEQILAAFLGVMAILGTGNGVIALISRPNVGALIYVAFALIGLVAFALSIYRPWLGLALSGVFYLPQLLMYSGPNGSWFFEMGFSLHMSFRSADTIYRLNVLALVLLLLAAARAADRWPNAKPQTSGGGSNAL